MIDDIASVEQGESVPLFDQGKAVPRPELTKMK